MASALVPPSIPAPLPSRTMTASGNALMADRVLLVDATAGPVTVALLPMAQTASRELVVSKTDSSANAVTVQAQPGEMINNVNSMQITTQYQTRRIYSDGGKGTLI